MELKVLKFGGSSLSDAAQIRKAAAIVRAQPERRYVVVSAPGRRFPEDVKITDLLYRCCGLAAEDKDMGPVFAQIRQRYEEIVSELGLALSLGDDLDTIEREIRAHASRDYVASRGEFLCARIFAAYLDIPFVDAADIIHFRRDGRVDYARTYRETARRLAMLPRAVIPGFYGTLPDGSIKTFPRDGSDITGALAARAVKASVYENWTDVSGIFMADPRIVTHPRSIAQITYDDVRELANMGASVIHEEAILPVREAGIPINIRNTNAPEEPGTMIGAVRQELRPSDTAITGMAGRTGFSLLTVQKDASLSREELRRGVLSALKGSELSCEQIHMDRNILTVALPTTSLTRCRDNVIRHICAQTQADTVTIQDGIALLCVVGKSVWREAPRLTAAIAAQNIHVCAETDRGPGRNILVGVREADYVQSFQAIYREAVGW